MFRLIKLCFYVLLGYALYELYQGMVSESNAQSGSSRGGRRSGSQRSGSGPLTGPGKGRTETTQEDSGISARHKVGRGVAH